MGVGKTDGAISSLIGRLDPDDGLALVNAIYFRGEWTRGVDPERTAPAPFRPRSGVTVEAPAMRIDGLDAGYRVDVDFKAVSLPYGDGDFAFAAALPRDGMASGEALGRLAGDPSWLAGEGFRHTSGARQLPRFALNGKNAFVGVAAPPPAPGRVVQHVVIEVEERRTTAFVSTMFMAEVTSIPVPFDLRSDRPFAFSIRHVSTGAVLFAAWVDNPTAG